MIFQNPIKFCFNIFRQITIEPIVFLIFAAFASLAVSEHTLLYRTVCLQNFGHLGIDCTNLTKNPNLEDEVQRIASTWTIFLSLSYVAPAIIAENFLGALSDLYGRKFNILLGFTGLIITIVPDLLLVAYPEIPLSILIISNVIAGFTGYAATVLLSCIAYLSDTVADEKALTFRMTIASICKSLGALSGAFLTGALAKYVSLGTCILLSEVVLVLGFFYTLAMIPNIVPERMSKAESVKPDVDNGISSRDTGSCIRRLCSMAKQVLEMNREVVRTLLKKRHYHKRAYLILCMVTYFCYTTSELGLQHGPIMSLFVFRRPFNWSPVELGTYKGVQHTFALGGSIFGAIAIKKFQNSKFNVTAIILLALASGFGFLLITGLSSSGHMLYIASAVGCFSTLLVPSMKSFVARQVDPGEVGKALAANGIAADLAFVLTTLVFTNIYNATLNVFAGFVFVLGAVVVAGCFCGMVWLHLDAAKQRRRFEETTKTCVATPTCVVSPGNADVKCFT